MMNPRFLIMFAILIIACTGCGRNSVSPATDTEEVTLLISAAASLSDVMNDISQKFQNQYPHIHLEVNYGASGTLKEQIVQGAPADLFFSAGQKQMDALQKLGLVTEATSVLRNSIVAVSSDKSMLELDSLEQLLHQAANKYIALGTPETVPAGMYTKQALENAGLWERWEDQLVFAKDVRQVLAYTAQGNVAIGFVYETDALLSDKVSIIYHVEPDRHDPITYPLGIVSTTKNIEEAQLLYKYLLGEQAKSIYEAYGFQAVE